MGGVYLFYVVEKILKIMIHIKKVMQFHDFLFSCKRKIWIKFKLFSILRLNEVSQKNPRIPTIQIISRSYLNQLAI
jgi:hypothetical protein